MAHQEFTRSKPFHRPWTVDYDLVAATSGTVTLKTARSASHRLYISHIIVSITTFSNKTLTFQDSAGTPVPIAFVTIPASGGSVAGLQAYIVDFLDAGTPLTTGKDLNMVISGAGPAGRIHVEGYEVIETPVAMGSTN